MNRGGAGCRQTMMGMVLLEERGGRERGGARGVDGWKRRGVS